jgi:hypothetical protein
MGTMSVAVVLIVADRPLRPLAAIPFGGKHETKAVTSARPSTVLQCHGSDSRAAPWS